MAARPIGPGPLQPALGIDGGISGRHRVWHPRCRRDRRRPGRTRLDDRVGRSLRNRRRRPPRRARHARDHDRGPGLRCRLSLPGRPRRPVREYRRRRSGGQRVAAGPTPRPAPVSGPQPRDRLADQRHRGRGGRRAQRRAEHRAARRRSGPGTDGGAGAGDVGSVRRMPPAGQRLGRHACHPRRRHHRDALTDRHRRCAHGGPGKKAAPASAVPPLARRTRARRSRIHHPPATISTRTAPGYWTRFRPAPTSGPPRSRSTLE